MPRLDADAIARLRALHAASTQGIRTVNFSLLGQSLEDSRFDAVAHNTLPDLLADWEDMDAEIKALTARLGKTANAPE